MKEIDIFMFFILKKLENYKPLENIHKIKKFTHLAQL